jgi:integrase
VSLQFFNDMPIAKLTPHIIANSLICPDNKSRIELCDTDLPGLYIEVRSTSPGQGTYYFRYKNRERKTCHQKVGRTTDISLTEARKKARQLKAEIHLGADPRGQAKAEKAVLTFDDFFTDHYLPYVKPRKRSWKRDEELYRLRIRAVFGQKRLNQITRQQVQTLHASVLAQGLAPATADHHVKLLRQALNRAIEWDLLDKNPIAGVELFNTDNKVEHLLSDAQLQSLLTVLRTHSNRAVCQIALFLLSTGCRLNEALKATWSQIDEGNRVWRIPASNSKSKKVRSVPLNDSALDVLRQLDTKDTFDHLFINKMTKKPYTTIMKVWSRLRQQAGLPHLRIHDLRHLYASFLVNAGRSLYEVQQILGHSSPNVTQRYAHLSTKSLQDAAGSASLAIRGTGDHTNTVVPKAAHVN